MSDTGIEVYISEPGGNYENSDFKRELELEFAAPFRFASIGRGAAATAWVTEVISFADTYGGYTIGLVIAAFFAGEKIEKGLDVWPRLFQRLKSTLHYQPTFDREGAAVLIANAISQRLGALPTYMRCNGFQIIDRATGTFVEIPEAMLLTAIGPRQKDLVSNRDVYYFDVEVDTRQFLGRLSFDEPTIVEICIKN